MKTIIKQFCDLNNYDLYELLKLRQDVFIIEQACIYPELDDKDYECMHVMIKDDDEIIAYARVLDKGVAGKDVMIGRVISKYRGQGIGAMVLEAAIEVARNHYHASCVRLEAQTYAIGFYEKKGFKVCGDEFLEDGIPHVPMVLIFKNEL